MPSKLKTKTRNCSAKTFRGFQTKTENTENICWLRRFFQRIQRFSPESPISSWRLKGTLTSPLRTQSTTPSPNSFTETATACSCVLVELLCGQPPCQGLYASVTTNDPKTTNKKCDFNNNTITPVLRALVQEKRTFQEILRENIARH